MSDRRKERLHRQVRENEHKDDPWLDSFGVGSGRKELARLIVQFSHGKPGKEEADKTARATGGMQRGSAHVSRMINLCKISSVVTKLPWQRRSDEVELVRADALHICSSAFPAPLCRTLNVCLQA